MFSRGYDVAREKTKGGSKFMRSCFNCKHFGYENKRSKHEVCLNDDVSQYDLTVEGNNVSCTQWQPYTDTKKDRLYGTRKTGRRMLDILEELPDE